MYRGGRLKAGPVVFILEKLQNGHFMPLDQEDEPFAWKRPCANRIGAVSVSINNCCCGYLGDEMLRLKMAVKERIREARMKLMKRKTTTQFWRYKGLSVRASNCLSMANIIDEQELIEKIATLDCLLALRNCGRQTAEEIWGFRTNVRLTSEYHQGIEITSSNSGDNHSAEAQLVFVPLLNIEISTDTWEVLQNTPVNSIRWSVRTQNVLLKKDFKTLAEVAEFSPKKWLRFKNFGVKSLTEIQEIVNKIIVNPDIIDPTDEHSAELPQIQTLSELGYVVFQRLQTRQKEIIRHYYGYGEIPKNLQQIGEALGISRERVRQLKKAVNTKISQGMDNRLITVTIFCLLSELIRDVLAKDGGWCSVENLQEIIHQRLGWGNSEQWIIDWFDEAFGEAWICLGTDEYKIVDGVCQLKSGEPFQDFLVQLAARFQRYGYRPLALEECQNLIQNNDGTMHNCDSSSTAFDSDRLLNVITSHPSLKVYRYGKIHIGLKAWTWFSPEKPMTVAGQASLIEWYLRTTNEPATAKAIANGIGDQLGNFRLMPFDVADICKKQSYRFRVDDNDAYGLYLWDESSKYQQALTELLSDRPLPIEQIIEALSSQESTETMLIVAALNFSDLFVEMMPFEWALKTQIGKIVEEEMDFDYTNLTFEDLMPKL